MDEWQLLQTYAKDRSEAAFAELVSRHLDWVYSVALRHVGDAHLAEDVVQSVFVLLARKARDLRPGTLLGGWLFRTTRHVAGHARRAEQRRKSREATAFTMIDDSSSPNTDEILWQQLAPHLDEAVTALPEADRSAILLRFYEKMPLRKVGERLGVSEEAAKKRVSRALERMRTFLGGRGVKLNAGVLAAIVAEKTVQAAPAAMAAIVVKISVRAAAASASAMLPQLARETLRAWRWAKLKLAAGLAVPSLALILVVANAGGLLTRHSGSRSGAVNLSPSTDIDTVAQIPDVDARSTTPSIEQSSLPKKTGALIGLVVDEQGQPVVGAKVWGGFGSQPFAEDTTDQAGQFALAKVAMPSFVTVTADGFAADQQAFDPTNAPASLVFRLSPVHPLEVRLVDETGQGVAGSRLFLQEWWGRAGTLAQHLAQQTDANGRLQWLSAPKGELQLSFGKAGFRYSRTNKVFADGKEHVIVLHPTATVTGSVTDSETGAPVTNFKLTMGHSQPWVPDDPVPMWDYQSQTGSNGFYKILIEEEQVPYLRIEADGFEIVETAIQLTNGVEGVRDFQLIPRSATNSIRGTVLMPDGSPAAGVEVALCTALVGVMLNGTAFEPDAFGNIPRAQRKDYRRKTDEQGSFTFDPRPGAHTLVAVGPAGLGQVRCFDFSKPLEIRLQPWGRVEGNVRTRDGQWDDRKVKWQRTGPLTSWMTLFYDSKGVSTRSDATGKFTLEHVPPGDGRVVIEDGPGTAPIFSPSIRVNPGETVEMQIGGVGRPVIGKLVAPPVTAIRSWSNQVTLAQLHVERGPYPLPKDLIGNAVERWKLEFEDTETGRNWLRDQCAYDFKVGEDGAFTIPEVLPGKYSLYLHVAQGYLGSGLDSKASNPGGHVIAQGGAKVAVTDAVGDNASAVDLGDIILIATP